MDKGERYSNIKIVSASENTLAYHAIAFSETAKQFKQILTSEN